MSLSPEMPSRSAEQQEALEREEILDNSYRIGQEAYVQAYPNPAGETYSQKIQPMSPGSPDAIIFTPRQKYNSTNIGSVQGFSDTSKYRLPGHKLADRFLDLIENNKKGAEEEDAEYREELDEILRGFADKAFGNENFAVGIDAAERAGILDKFKELLNEKARTSGETRERIRKAFMDSDSSFTDYIDD